jgi:hypothetical protein
VIKGNQVIDKLLVDVWAMKPAPYKDTVGGCVVSETLPRHKA